MWVPSDASIKLDASLEKDSKNNRMYILYRVLAVWCYVKVIEMQLMARTFMHTIIYIMFKLSVPICYTAM